MLNCTMLLATRLAHGDALCRSLSAESDRYSIPCCFRPRKCCSALEEIRLATTAPAMSSTTMSSTFSSVPVMSVQMTICLALVLLPSLACASLTSGESFQGNSVARRHYGVVTRGIDVPKPSGIAEFTPEGKTYRQSGHGFVMTSSFENVRGRKMLFGALSCTPQDLSLTQGPVSSTSGIPTFAVQIVNLCGICAMGQIHVACGNWASATPVDPFVFKRLGFNDCLVDNGAPLSSQGSVSFQYSNSAMYPMSITSATSEC